MNSKLLIVLLILFVIISLIIIYTDRNNKVKLSSKIPLEIAIGKHEAKTLLLSCIDFRFINMINNFMNKNNYSNDYDYTSLAGRSLGVNQKLYNYSTRHLIILI